MSFTLKGHRMRHTAANTDPLEEALQQKQNYYGLKLRQIPHVKVNELKDLKLWYDIGAKIGEGGFGMVAEITDRNTSKKFAMKAVAKNNVERLKFFQREIKILQLVQHPHIVYLDRVFETSKEIYMVFEWCKGDFANVYLKKKPFSEIIARKVISEVTDAVAYLHKYGEEVMHGVTNITIATANRVKFSVKSRFTYFTGATYWFNINLQFIDIVHRDLKMENILLGENPDNPADEYYTKLSDFGLSIVKTSGLDSMLHDFCGTAPYMSPEMITVRSYSQQCDIWALGVILFMLVVGNFPFVASSEKELQHKICHAELSFGEASLSVELEDLLRCLLTKDPVNRIRATEVLQHPWILDKNIAKARQSNILKMMKEWKSEMQVATGQESDWVVFEVKGKQQMVLPKTNINFDRTKRGNTSKRANAAAKPQTQGSRTINLK